MRRNFFSILMFVLVALLCTHVVIYTLTTDIQAERWERRATCADGIATINAQIYESHRYSKTLMESLRVVTNENGILCERDAISVRTIAAMEEENQRLKMSLKETCDMLLESINANEELHRDLDGLRWQVQQLQHVITELTRNVPTPAVPVEEENFDYECEVVDYES